MDEWERQGQLRHAAYQRDVAPVIAALTDAGIDAREFGRFVNRPVPGLLQPSSFDNVAALPVLLHWLPRVANEDVKQSMVQHLKTKAAKPVATTVLLEEFRAAENPTFKWIIADVLEYVSDKGHYPQLVDLAADPRHGSSRAPLIDMLWRIKTSEADQVLLQSLDDPDVARAAMSALRRRLGNTRARPLIEPLMKHPHERVTQAATDHLRRIDRALGKLQSP